MPRLDTVVDGFISAREYDKATLGRLQFWVDELGHLDITDITEDDVDAAIVRLVERGRLRAGRNVKTRRTGKPLAGSSVNRYIGQLAQVYKYARRLRLLPRSHVPPTRGVEKAPENTAHDRYFRPEEVERLISITRLIDTKWGKMESLLVLAYHTGLRRSNLLNLRWRDVDLNAGTITVAMTKNGDPHVAALSERATTLLGKLPGKSDPDVFVFAGPRGTPLNIRRLWVRCCKEAGIEGRTFHSLRHGCGHALAQAGVNQAIIMKIMGHRSLSASARYMHASTGDKRRVIEEVFA